jgi:hypothetical protein
MRRKSGRAETIAVGGAENAGGDGTDGNGAAIHSRGSEHDSATCEGERLGRQRSSRDGAQSDALHIAPGDDPLLATVASGSGDYCRS